MACIYSDNECKCTLWDKVHNKDQDYTNSDMGFNKEGYCAVEDDPVPSDNCSSFEPVDSYEFDDDGEENQ